MSNENAATKGSVFHWFKMGSSFDNQAQFMDSLYFQYAEKSKSEAIQEIEEKYIKSSST